MFFDKARSGLVLAFIIITAFNSLYAQTYNRVQARVSIKTKYVDGKGLLEMGDVYFDKANKKLVYDFSFPEKISVVINDTALFVIENGIVVNRRQGMLLLEFNLFNVILNGELNNFGLRGNPVYKIEKVERAGGMVITTWEFKGKEKNFGKVLVSTKNGDLYGVVILDPDGRVASRQIFEKYVLARGLKFPTEITQIIHYPEGDIIQVTTFKNIVVNSPHNENYYNYAIPF